MNVESAAAGFRINRGGLATVDAARGRWLFFEIPTSILAPRDWIDIVL
jgi:hypothetical protein